MSVDELAPASVVVDGLEVAYGRRRVLRGVSLACQPGRIRALLGANGAGKSTLIKCLGGGVAWQAGTISIDGQEVTSLSPRESRDLGIAIIYQDLKLIGPRSVAENLFLGREPRRGPFVRGRERRRRARAVLDDLGVDVDVDQPVLALPPALRQMVAIARAVVEQPRLLVLDEATAALDDDEVERLGEFLRGFRSKGIPVLFVTHLLDEVFDLADDVSVLRDGVVALDGEVDKQDRKGVIHAIAGRTLAEGVDELAPHEADGGFIAHGLRSKVLRDVSLEVRPGEVVGLFGALGCGRSEVALAVAGAESADGQMTLDAQPYAPRSVADAISSGVAFVPPDRTTQAIFGPMTAHDNVVLPAMRSLARFGMRRQQRERAHFSNAADVLGIVPRQPTMPAWALSGGNQQKLVVGRWLGQQRRTTRLLVLDEPTAGVDVGARADMYRALHRLAEEGLSILVSSSEPEEIRHLCHRVLVLHKGRVVGELARRDMDEHTMLALAHHSPSGDPTHA